MMNEAIKNFAKQFAYEPIIENADQLGVFDSYVLLGMGGSHLSADIVKKWKPEISLIVHRNYGLPELKEEQLKKSLIIASSYSGNTEEVVSGAEEAMGKGLAVAVVAVGGKLIEFATTHNLPYIQMPDFNIQPRSALGLSLISLLKIVGDEEGIREAHMLASSLVPEAFEEQGKILAGKLKGYVPVIYASEKNEALAYNWKIKYNETGKIPAFYNVFSELNHNEMTGFDVHPSTQALCEKFSFIILRDTADNPHILRRMEACAQMYRDRGLSVHMIDESGESYLQKIFSSLLLADWTAYYSALQYGLEPEAVPMVEEFKKYIADKQL